MNKLRSFRTVLEIELLPPQSVKKGRQSDGDESDRCIALFCFRRKWNFQFIKLTSTGLQFISSPAV